ncbi:hypothetical protein [Prosthecobacter sp.]|uniref:hypothetical protein n=1 Tax=Prosthecobacter sp. TaxID=1965333 RepID=UPI003784716D
MTEEHIERIYEGIRRMVFSDEPSEDILHRLEVNGIPSEEARQMLEKARAERMSEIRSAALKQAVLGFSIMLSAYGMFMGFFAINDVLTQEIVALCALTAAIGVWQFSKGLYYLLFAHNKKGPLIDPH